MNIEEHLILIDNKEKTNEISYYENNGTYFSVKFNNNPQVYKYQSGNRFYVYERKRNLNPTSYKIKRDERTLFKIQKIIDFGDYLRIYFEGKHAPILYKTKELDIKESILTNIEASQRFNYLKFLSKIVGIKTDMGKEILYEKYNEMKFVDCTTVLADYLTARNSLDTIKNENTIIFPFGFNSSQKKAVERAFENKISIIEGPPGTGKTQTILNIIANIIMSGKTVAVVSNNNSATANVVEKLQKYNLSFIAAFLGKSKNKEKFIEEQGKTTFDTSNWNVKDGKREQFWERTVKLCLELNGKLLVQKELVQKKLEYNCLETEKKYFDKYLLETNHTELNYPPLRKFNSNQIYKLWIELLHEVDIKKRITLYFKIQNVFRYGFWRQDFYKYSLEDQIIDFQKRFYVLRKKELETEIAGLENELNHYNFEDKMKEMTELSMILFKDTLYKKYGNMKERNIFTKESLWRESEKFLKEYPLILSTTHSLKGSLSQDTVYDYLIIDEASQVDIVSGALALACAKNVVIVGDLMQLPNVVTKETGENVEPILEEYQPGEEFNYVKHSLLSSFQEIFPKVSRTMLKEHYRCHPKIIQFCNQKFYNGELIIMTENKNEKDTLKAFITTEGNHARGHYNQRQIDVIKKEILPYFEHELDEVGIVSPYREQKLAIEDQIIEDGIAIDTVHKFQGREKNNIILTTVDNIISEFTDNPNMLNVAVSRAKDHLFVVVSNNERNANTNIDDLVRYIQYNNMEIIHSKTYSVFDLLYKGFTKRRMDFIKKRKSKYDSENLMYQIILRVLTKKQFMKLGVKSQYQLKNLIKDGELLTEAERKYAMHGNTAIDFLIFEEATDKRPVLAIEVDGYKYHNEDKEQGERDKKKNTILEKYCVPYIRFNTVESGEEKLLIKRLDDIMSI
jgi:Type III restriction enzyme, res subunit./Protein of unknown function (DUF2726)./Viral (Superfamily 1) RNA helicase.